MSSKSHKLGSQQLAKIAQLEVLGRGPTSIPSQTTNKQKPPTNLGFLLTPLAPPASPALEASPRGSGQPPRPQ